MFPADDTPTFTSSNQTTTNMKAAFKLNQRSIKVLLVLWVALVGTTMSNTTTAQRAPKGYSFANYYRGANVFIMGIEGGPSMRMFTINSDIEAIDQLKVIQEGWSGGVSIGGKAARAKLLFGNYSMTSTIYQNISEKSFGGQVNLYPLSLLGVQSKYFQPYVLGGLDISNISFYGTYIPAPKLPAEQQKEKCPCDCDGSGGLPGDPDLASSTPPSNPGEDPDLESEPKPRVDKLLATQAMVGLGMECSFRANGKMFSFFGEARYGLPLGVEAITAPLQNTAISGQVVLYFGVSIGISK
jgi:hypothetical protein